MSNTVQQHWFGCLSASLAKLKMQISNSREAEEKTDDITGPQCNLLVFTLRGMYQVVSK